MIVALPEMSKTIAGKSYFHLKTSLRQHIASIALVTMAVAMFAVRRVISANGKTTIGSKLLQGKKVYLPA